MLALNKKTRASLELALAASIWGFAFIQLVWCLEFAGPFWVSTLRFGIGFLFCFILLLFQVLRCKANLFQDFWLACPAGVFLGVTLLFQTWGLEYTTVAKSGFITTLYVILVPLIVWVIEKKDQRSSIIWAILALFGTAMMAEFKLSGWNKGDTLTFGCAIGAACQIYTVGRHGTKMATPFTYNLYQAFWAALVSLPLALMLENTPSWVVFKDPKFIGALLFLAIISTSFAFFLQVKAQRELSQSLSSILALLESPFAAFFGWILLGQLLSPIQMGGAFVIFMSAVLASRQASR